jgi:hypothetical protein
MKASLPFATRHEVTMTESSDLTLGELRNRIDALIQRNKYDPALSAGFVLSGDKFHELCASEEDRQRLHRDVVR